MISATCLSVSLKALSSSLPPKEKVIGARGSLFSTTALEATGFVISDLTSLGLIGLSDNKLTSKPSTELVSLYTLDLLAPPMPFLPFGSARK